MRLDQLPLFKDLSATDHWPSYLAQMFDAEYDWVQVQRSQLNLTPDLETYLDTTLALWRQAAVVAGNKHQNFATYALRPILERVGLIWTAHSAIPLDPQQLVNDFESNDRKRRTTATDSILDEVKKHDPVLDELYQILSRYFSHVSHLDRIKFFVDDPKDELFALRSRVLPLLLIFDVGHCVTNVVNALLQDQGNETPPITTGRGVNVVPYKFIRVAAYVMCEKHSTKRPVKFGALLSNIGEISGEIGITDIYRGGMELFRYGSPEEEASHETIAEVALFAVGHVDPTSVKVKLVQEGSKGEQYSLSWPKTLEVDGVALAMIASDNRLPLPFFDYVTAFLNTVTEHQKTKAPSPSTNP